MGGGSSKDKGEHPITKRPYKGSLAHHETDPNRPDDPEAPGRHPITKRPYKSGSRKLNCLAKQKTADEPGRVEEKTEGEAS